MSAQPLLSKLLVVVAALGLVLLLGVACGRAAQAPGATSPLTVAPAPAATPAAVATPRPTPTPVPAVVIATPTPVTAAEAPKPAAEQPRYGGILEISYYLEPPGFDCHQQQLLVTRMACVPVYDGLLEPNPQKQYELVPDLAERWEVSPDGKTFTFHLVKGVKFHDGTPMTSEDVRYSLERLRNPPKGILSPKKSLFASIEAIQAPDPSTVVIRMKGPDNSLFVGLGNPHHAIYPKHVVEKEGDMKRVMVGTGPFKFVRYDRGVVLELTKNPDYFRKGRPYLDGLRLSIILDAGSRLAALRVGKVKLHSFGGGSPGTEEIEILKRTMADKFDFIEYPGLATGWINFNVSRKPWDDVRLRKAVHLAIDRQELIDAGGGRGKRGTVVVSGSPWALPDEELLKLPGYRHPKDQDLAEAKRLMAQAGFPNGFTETFIVRNLSSWIDSAQILREQMKRIGLTLDLKAEETGLWAERLAKEDYGIIYEAFGVSTADPSESLSLFIKPFISFKDSLLDELINKQQSTLDQQERYRIVRQIEQRVLELLPVATYTWGISQMVKSKCVRNYGVPFGLWNAHHHWDVWLAC